MTPFLVKKELVRVIREARDAMVNDDELALILMKKFDITTKG